MSLNFLPEKVYGPWIIKFLLKFYALFLFAAAALLLWMYIEGSLMICFS